jgi:hypothetical protein
MVGNAFVFMQFQEGGGLLFEMAGSSVESVGDWGLGIGGCLFGIGIGAGFVMETSEAVLAWAEGDSVGRVVDVVGWERKMDKGAA